MVRQAMEYVTPYDQIIKSVYLGKAKQMDSPIPQIYPDYKKQTPYAHDLQKAKELLAAAGMPHGFSTTLSYDAARPDQEQIAVLMKSSCAQIGIKLALSKLPSATFSDLQQKRKLALFFWQDMPIQPDPGYALYLYYYGPAFTTYSNYNDSRVNKLIDVATSTPPGAARSKALDEAQALIWKDAPHIWIVWPGWHYSTRDTISGVNWLPANNTRWELLTKS
jgi:peptide/nickel transport system substrate-binding protein